MGDGAMMKKSRRELKGELYEKNYPGDLLYC